MLLSLLFACTAFAAAAIGDHDTCGALRANHALHPSAQTKARGQHAQPYTILKKVTMKTCCETCSANVTGCGALFGRPNRHKLRTQSSEQGVLQATVACMLFSHADAALLEAVECGECSSAVFRTTVPAVKQSDAMLQGLQSAAIATVAAARIDIDAQLRALEVQLAAVIRNSATKKSRTKRKLRYSRFVKRSGVSGKANPNSWRNAAYHSSKWEKLWLDNIRKWQGLPNDDWKQMRNKGTITISAPTPILAFIIVSLAPPLGTLLLWQI